MTTQPAVPPDGDDAASPEAPQGESHGIFDRGHDNEQRGRELVAASPVPDSVVTLDRAIAILSLAYHETLDPATPPERLYQLRTEVDALHALLVKFRYSDAAANSAAALRIVNEREIGRHLRTLERQPGSRSGPSEYGAELKQRGLSYPLAARWQLFAQAGDELMNEHLGSALEMLEHGFYIDEQDPNLASPGPQISSTWFERQVRSALPGDEGDAGATEPAGDVPRAASDAGLGWSPPELLLDHARAVLGGLDRVIDGRDLADREWSGRLLVVPPAAATIGFSENLLARFSAWARRARDPGHRGRSQRPLVGPLRRLAGLLARPGGDRGSAARAAQRVRRQQRRRGADAVPRPLRGPRLRLPGRALCLWSGHRPLGKRRREAGTVVHRGERGAPRERCASLDPVARGFRCSPTSGSSGPAPPEGQ